MRSDGKGEETGTSAQKGTIMDMNEIPPGRCCRRDQPTVLKDDTCCNEIKRYTRKPGKMVMRSIIRWWGHSPSTVLNSGIVPEIDSVRGAPPLFLLPKTRTTRGRVEVLPSTFKGGLLELKVEKQMVIRSNLFKNLINIPLDVQPPTW